MKYHVWGIESLTKKEIKKLKSEGVIKVRRSRFSRDLPEGEDDEAENANEGSKKNLKVSSSITDNISASNSVFTHMEKSIERSVINQMSLSQQSSLEAELGQKVPKKHIRF